MRRNPWVVWIVRVGPPPMPVPGVAPEYEKAMEIVPPGPDGKGGSVGKAGGLGRPRPVASSSGYVFFSRFPQGFHRERPPLALEFFYWTPDETPSASASQFPRKFRYCSSWCSNRYLCVSSPRREPQNRGLFVETRVLMAVGIPLPR